MVKKTLTIIEAIEKGLTFKQWQKQSNTTAFDKNYWNEVKKTIKQEKKK
jgi:hypothetical protein